MSTMFTQIAEALREVGEKNGYEIYVSVRHRAIDLTKTTTSRTGREEDINVKLRTRPCR